MRQQVEVPFVIENNLKKIFLYKLDRTCGMNHEV